MSFDNCKESEQIEYTLQIGNIREWRQAKILKIQMNYWSSGPRHRPYKSIVVEVERTYFKNGEYYNKLNKEHVFYSDQIRKIK